MKETVMQRIGHNFLEKGLFSPIQSFAVHCGISAKIQSNQLTKGM